MTTYSGRGDTTPPKMHYRNVNVIRSFPSFDMIYDIIFSLTATRLTPSGSSTVHIYTQTMHRTTQ